MTDINFDLVVFVSEKCKPVAFCHPLMPVMINIDIKKNIQKNDSDINANLMICWVLPWKYPVLIKMNHVGSTGYTPFRVQLQVGVISEHEVAIQELRLKSLGREQHDNQ